MNSGTRTRTGNVHSDPKQPQRLEILVPSESIRVSTQDIDIIRRYTDTYTDGKRNKSNRSDAISLFWKFGSPEAVIEACRRRPGYQRRDLEFIMATTRCGPEIAQEALQQSLDVNVAIAVIYYTDMRHNQRSANALYFSVGNGSGFHYLKDSGSHNRKTGVKKSGEARRIAVRLERVMRRCEDGEPRADSEETTPATRHEIVKRVLSATTRHAREREREQKDGHATRVQPTAVQAYGGCLSRP